MKSFENMAAPWENCLDVIYRHDKLYQIVTHPETLPKYMLSIRTWSVWNGWFWLIYAWIYQNLINHGWSTIELCEIVLEVTESTNNIPLSDKIVAFEPMKFVVDHLNAIFIQSNSILNQNMRQLYNIGLILISCSSILTHLKKYFDHPSLFIILFQK